jgi:hypothetical protein
MTDAQYLSKARRRWPNAWFEWEQRGRFALIQECKEVTVWRYPTLEEARRALGSRTYSCGSNCPPETRHLQHYIVDLADFRKAPIYGV